MTDRDTDAVGRKLRRLRTEAGLSLREVGQRAGVAPSYLSSLERGGSSPTLYLLHGILSALGTDIQSFFTEQAPEDGKTHIFRRERMRSAADTSRRYTFLLPRRAGISSEMLDEYLLPGEPSPVFERNDSEVAGLVITGVLELEIEGLPVERLRPGDAFHVPAGTPHRGRCAAGEPVRLITVFVPPEKG